MILLKRTKWLALGLCGAMLLAALTACSADSGQEETVSPTPTPEETESVSATPAAEEEDAVQETAAPDETADAGLTLAFTLLDADGAPLSDASLQLTIGEDQADYPAEEDGTLTVSGLPRTGTAELVLTDASGGGAGHPGAPALRGLGHRRGGQRGRHRLPHRPDRIGGGGPYPRHGRRRHPDLFPDGGGAVRIIKFAKR